MTGALVIAAAGCRAAAQAWVGLRSTASRPLGAGGSASPRRAAVFVCLLAACLAYVVPAPAEARAVRVHKPHFYVGKPRKGKPRKGVPRVASLANANATYITIAPPGAVTSEATGVIRTGRFGRSLEVVGWYTDVANFEHGFVWTGGNHYTTLDVPGSVGSTSVAGINHDGEIIGGYSIPPSYIGCTFLYANGGFQPYSLENSCESNTGYNQTWTVLGINDSHELVGDTNDFEGPTVSHTYGPEAFYDGPTTGTVIFPFQGTKDYESELDGINDKGEMVGAYTTPDSSSRYAIELTAKGNLQKLSLPGSWSQANGINDGGAIVGWYANGDDGFISDGNTTNRLDYPGSQSTDPRGISDSTDVVNSGYYVVGSYLPGDSYKQAAFLAHVTPATSGERGRPTAR
jgi:hypothetical protein